ncbi:MAG: DUF302 domain-containing protein [candidate division Zixibacteria bacterium]|nr:DUF302 domain-containing protein [candidate division Zixibacteria bacterium]
MIDKLAYRMEFDKPFGEVAAEIEKQAAERQFRILAIHDVQETLAEKGFERGPLKIIEVCNAGFAHRATQKDIHVALFMPCKFTCTPKGTRQLSPWLGRL